MWPVSRGLHPRIVEIMQDAEARNDKRLSGHQQPAKLRSAWAGEGARPHTTRVGRRRQEQNLARVGRPPRTSSEEIREGYNR